MADNEKKLMSQVVDLWPLLLGVALVAVLGDQIDAMLIWLIAHSMELLP